MLSNAKYCTSFVILSLLGMALSPFIALADLSDPGALQTHNPLLIDADDEFDVVNGVVAGNGTASNPYIIENWTISTSSLTGVQIQDTRAHFVVRNCKIGDTSSKNGIDISNATNGTIINNRIEKARIGIRMVKSSEILVKNNSVVDNSWEGIHVSQSINITVKDNDIYDNTDEGIDVWDSEYIQITGNNIYNNTDHGIENDYCTRITIANNHIYDNSWTGVHLEDASKTSVANNTISGNNQDGIYIEDSDYVVVENNTIFDHDYGAGIDTWDDLQLTINDNRISNSYHGLILQYVYKVTLVGNEVSNAYFGLVLYGTQYGVLYGNELVNNTMNFGVNYEYSSHTIAENNTINGKPIYYWKGASSRAVPSDAGFVGLIECDNITMTGLSFSNNYHGLIAFNTRDSTVSGNTFNDTTYGAEIWGSSISFIDNEVHQNEVGLLLKECDNSTFENNTLSQSEQILEITQSDHVAFINNRFNGSTIGLKVISGDNISIVDCDFENILYTSLFVYYSERTTIAGNRINNTLNEGLLVQSSDDNVIRDNIITNVSSYGIQLESSDRNLVENNVLNNTYWDGINVASSHLNDIRNNQISYAHSDGIDIEHSHKNRIVNNTIYNISQTAIEMDYPAVDNLFAKNKVYNSGEGIKISARGFNTTIHSNYIFNNFRGLYIRSDQDLLFYNNYLDNGENCDGSLVGIRANITKTPGINIVGGPYLGGNYWSDYIGVDQDNDFLGDTNIPFNEGDMYPLIPAQPLMDRTNQTPRTGSNFTFNATTLTPGLDGMSVLFSYNGSPVENRSIPRISGDMFFGNYSVDITIPIWAMNLTYRIEALDINGKLYNTSNRTLDVIDDIGPRIIDNSSSPTTGDPYSFDIQIEDNRADLEFTFEYWMDDDEKVMMNQSNLTTDITIPTDARTLHFLINATDGSNHTTSLFRELEVLDNDVPVLEVTVQDDPVTGGVFSFECTVRDNIGIDGVYFTYWFDTNRYDIMMMPTREKVVLDVPVPLDARNMEYSVETYDLADNKVTYNGTFLVWDNILPLVRDLSGTVITTGEDFLVIADMTDNVGVDRAMSTLAFWFDGHDRTEVNFDGDRVVKVPLDAKELHYAIDCVDLAGNTVTIENTLTIVDNDAPTLEDLTRSDLGEWKTINFKVMADDNIGIKDVHVDVWIDGKKSTYILEKAGEYYTGKVKVPEDGRTVRYSVRASDAAGNTGIGMDRVYNLASDDFPYAVLWLLVALVIALLIVSFYLTSRIPRVKMGGAIPEDELRVAGTEDLSEE